MDNIDLRQLEPYFGTSTHRNLNEIFPIVVLCNSTPTSSYKAQLCDPKV